MYMVFSHHHLLKMPSLASVCIWFLCEKLDGCRCVALHQPLSSTPLISESGSVLYLQQWLCGGTWNQEWWYLCHSEFRTVMLIPSLWYFDLSFKHMNLKTFFFFFTILVNNCLKLFLKRLCLKGLQWICMLLLVWWPFSYISRCAQYISLLASSSMSFFSILIFSSCSSFTSLVRFIPGHFVYFETVMSTIVSHLLLSLFVLV